MSSVLSDLLAETNMSWSYYLLTHGFRVHLPPINHSDNETSVNETSVNETSVNEITEYLACLFQKCPCKKVRNFFQVEYHIT